AEADIGTFRNDCLVGAVGNTLCTFGLVEKIRELGDNLFQETPASGEAVIGNPDEEGLAYMKQGYLESSNVDPVKEITELISA
ncbi:flagellar basal body rod C-terminal domain-containing protein, partial [Rhizobium ruizarguesonis]